MFSCNTSLLLKFYSLFDSLKSSVFSNFVCRSSKLDSKIQKLFERSQRTRSVKEIFYYRNIDKQNFLKESNLFIIYFSNENRQKCEMKALVAMEVRRIGRIHF
jgi:hypothetical protein